MKDNFKSILLTFCGELVMVVRRINVLMYLEAKPLLLCHLSCCDFCSSPTLKDKFRSKLLMFCDELVMVVRRLNVLT